jgi:8-oxo-dGTP diphosphatase
LNLDLPEFGTPSDQKEVLRRAAYALIRDTSGRVLAVRGERGLFLPGGGLEAGESSLAAVRREMLEETGHELGGCEYVGSAVQHFEHDGVSFRMTADFFVASLGDHVSTNAEYELHWVAPESGGWYHACHEWAAQLGPRHGSEEPPYMGSYVL